MTDEPSTLDLDDFYAEVRSPGGTCKFVGIYAALPPDEAVKLHAAMARPYHPGEPNYLPHRAIERWLEKRNHRASVGRHRLGGCECQNAGRAL